MALLSIRLNTLLLLMLIVMVGAVMAMFAARAYGGPLDPPGPVASTQSTLIYQPASCAGFPIVLSTIGSYRLGGTITGCTAKDGIQITSSNVTLDLGGFTLFGVAGSLDGVSVTSGSYVVIQNGSVRGWTNGINASISTYSRVDGVRSTNNANVGIAVGSGSEITNCTVSRNNGIGIDVSFVVVRNCTVAENVSVGIRVADYSRVEDNGVYNNGNELFITGSFNTIRNNDVGDIVVDFGSFSNVLIGNQYCDIFQGGTNTVLIGNVDRVDAC